MKVKPKKLNFKGNRFYKFLQSEERFVGSIDKNTKSKEAERDIMEYPTEVNDTGRAWSF